MARTLAEIRQSRATTPEVVEAYAAARLRYELGNVVRERREELGWSQTELGRRTGMRQPAIARFEAGGTTPTLPVLERLAEALGLKLTVQMTPRAKTALKKAAPAAPRATSRKRSRTSVPA